MVRGPTGWAGPEDHAGAIENPDFWIRTKLEPENRFSRFALKAITEGVLHKVRLNIYFTNLQKRGILPLTPITTSCLHMDPFRDCL